MPAPGSLYAEGAQLMESNAGQAANIAKERQAVTDTTVQAGDSAGKNLSAERQNISSQQATMALEKLKASEKMQGKVITITPQLALGLAKNTGDKEWMQAIGQDMRSDVLLGMYTHGMSLALQTKAPKVTEVYDKSGRVRHAVVYTDENGNIQQHLLDEGMASEKLHPSKGSAGGGKAGDDLKKNKEFIHAHEKQAALFNDATRSAQLKSIDLEQWNRQHEEYIKDQDRYDQLKTSLGKAGGGGVPEAGAAAAPDNAPFDADAFIKDALGQ